MTRVHCKEYNCLSNKRGFCIQEDIIIVPANILPPFCKTWINITKSLLDNRVEE
jgi:hypothetical protein